MKWSKVIYKYGKLLLNKINFNVLGHFPFTVLSTEIDDLPKPWPPAEAYMIDNLDERDRTAFFQWYDTVKDKQ